MYLLAKELMTDLKVQSPGPRQRRVQIQNSPLKCHPTLDVGRTVGPSLATSGKRGFRLLTKTDLAPHLPIKFLELLTQHIVSAIKVPPKSPRWIALHRLARVDSVGIFVKPKTKSANFSELIA